MVVFPVSSCQQWSFRPSVSDSRLTLYSAKTMIKPHRTSVWETIRKLPLVKAQTALGKYKKYVTVLKFCEKLLPHAKFNWNWALNCWVIAKKRVLKWRPSAILNFWGAIMGPSNSPFRTYCWLSLETIAVNCLVFDKIAFLYTFLRQTNKRTGTSRKAALTIASGG